MLSLDAEGKVLSASIVDGEVCLTVDDEVKVLGMMVPRKSRALEPIDEALLESVFASYGAGDDRWRQLCTWSTPKDEQKKMHWAVTLLIRILLLVVIFAFIPDQYVPNFVPPAFRGTQLLFALFPLAVAGGITWGAFYILNEKLHLFMQMSSWATCSATILQSEVFSEQRTDTYYTGKSDVSRSTVVTLYSAQVAYEYTVASKRYFSTQVGLSDGVTDSDPSSSRAIIERYPVGAQVPVFYNPKHPSRSALEKGMPKSGKFMLLIGLAVAMLVLTMALIFSFVL
jgi:hypothetical protein